MTAPSATAGASEAAGTAGAQQDAAAQASNASKRLRRAFCPPCARPAPAAAAAPGVQSTSHTAQQPLHGAAAAGTMLRAPFRPPALSAAASAGAAPAAPVSSVGALGDDRPAAAEEPPDAAGRSLTALKSLLLASKQGYKQVGAVRICTLCTWDVRCLPVSNGEYSSPCVHASRWHLPCICMAAIAPSSAGVQEETHVSN